MERVVREQLTTQDVGRSRPRPLINIRPVVASIEFFGTSQLSQFMDQNNPALAGPDAQASPVGARPGWSLTRPRGMEVRDVHSSHYGRMCPIRTPGPNIGLIPFARVLRSHQRLRLHQDPVPRKVTEVA